MKYLFSAPQELNILLKKRNKFIMLDYDGTLTPIVEKPELAVLHKDMNIILKKLAAKYPIAIISGRSLKELKNLVKVDGIYYAGNHGFEISNDTEYIHPSAALTQPIIREVCSKLDRKLKRIKGVIVENKGLTASVHYRMVSEKYVESLKASLREFLKPYLERGKIRVTRGKKVFELRPNIDWDKGKAIEWLVKVTNKEAYLPLYIGDDRTDEDAFLVLREKGLGILVTLYKKESFAKYFVKNVAEVEKFLNFLL
ncbi:MAG: trehalose-phosphatase [Candidatus Thermoplasmatota archaeon]|nr:trehalose-phosphatase [Candidatus Thermoplasmatota archaeon]